MSEAGHQRFDVLVGGAGIAAAATCVRLISLGFRPLVLRTSSPLLPGIEAIPEVALPLFTELGMEEVLLEAQAAVVEGFENHWRDNIVRPGRWIHVERTRLAEAAMREAERRGTVVQNCRSLPSLLQERDGVQIRQGNEVMRFGAAVDATGRSAVWSRPVCRHGQQVADLYSVQGGESLRGRVIKIPQGWAYRIGLNQSMTVAMVAAYAQHRSKPSIRVLRALGLKSGDWNYAGRRPAFPQWAKDPIQGRRLAVGDAALAYDPVAGQGIRFALSSAIAAATVVNTWRHSSAESDAAGRFYRTFVDQARQKHLQFVEELWKKAPRETAPVSLPEAVVFSGEIASAELQVDSRIVSGEAVRLRDGNCVRWVGGVDLLRIRDLARTPVQSDELTRRLLSQNLDPQRAAALLAWCTREGVLASVPDDSPL